MYKKQIYARMILDAKEYDRLSSQILNGDKANDQLIDDYFGSFRDFRATLRYFSANESVILQVNGEPIGEIECDRLEPMLTREKVDFSHFSESRVLVQSADVRSLLYGVSLEQTKAAFEASEVELVA